MEKRGVIEEGRTPVEKPAEKRASRNLEDHLTKRLADTAQKGCKDVESNKQDSGRTF